MLPPESARLGARPRGFAAQIKHGAGGELQSAVLTASGHDLSAVALAKADAREPYSP